MWPHRQPTRFPHPWDPPGKNTGVSCHFLLQCMKVNSESEVAQSCLTLGDPMDCSPPGSSVHGIFQARALEWGATAFSTCMLRHVWFFANSMDCSPPSSSVYGIFQTRILEWVAISSSRGSSQPRDWTQVSCIADRCFITETPGKPLSLKESMRLSEKVPSHSESLEKLSLSFLVFLFPLYLLSCQRELIWSMGENIF